MGRISVFGRPYPACQVIQLNYRSISILFRTPRAKHLRKTHTPGGMCLTQKGIPPVVCTYGKKHLRCLPQKGHTPSGIGISCLKVIDNQQVFDQFLTYPPCIYPRWVSGRLATSTTVAISGSRPKIENSIVTRSGRKMSRAPLGLGTVTHQPAKVTPHSR